MEENPMARGERTEHHPRRKVGRKSIKLTEIDNGGGDYERPMSKRQQKDSWTDEEFKQKTGRRILPSTNAMTGEVDNGRY